MNEAKRSSIRRFYQKTIAERRAIAKAWGQLSDDDLKALSDSGLTLSQADLMIENVIGRYSLPFRPGDKLPHQLARPA